MGDKKGSNIVWFTIAGCIVVATILIIGTIAMGRSATRNTDEAVHNVSLLYLDELAKRREQVVTTTINGYIDEINIALGLMTKDDLKDTESFQAYQAHMKQLYQFERFAFVDEDGLIYTSTGTRTDIDNYDFDYKNFPTPTVFIKDKKNSDNRVVIAISVDHLPYNGHELIVLLAEIDMEHILEQMSLRGDSNNNTTFCNLYTKDGRALTEYVLGGLASEGNLLEALEHATMMQNKTLDEVKNDFDSHTEGYVSFSYNGIHETLYYVPVQNTDWMLTYLIREGLISDQISSVSDNIIIRSVIQSLLTAVILVTLFSVLILQIKRNSKMTLEAEVLKTENTVRQQELEEQVAMQEELRVQEQRLSEALRAAEDANQAKSRFVSDMSHEIRTPITAILGMNEMIHRESKDDNILEYSENIDKAGTSLLGIISDILDFSKIESGKIELVNVCYSLKSMISDLYNMVHLRAEAKGLHVILDIDETLPSELYGDELRVKQIIVNMLTNAVKYTNEGTIRFTMRRESSFDEVVTLYVEVSDTGIGIKEQDLDRLFSSFERLDVERNRTIEGTGLGLTITRQLLDHMGSKLEVESTYDVGSRFYFSLKQGIGDAAPIGHFDIEKIAADASSRRQDENPLYAPTAKILIVDDTPINLQVIAALLKRSGMQIDKASSGMECIELFGKNSYDIVFLDYRMPGLDGIETIRQLKALYPEIYECTPIISLTASAVAGDREKMLGEGFTDYLSKPIGVTEMEKTLRTYIPKEKQQNKAESGSDKTLDNNKTDNAIKTPKEQIENLKDHKDLIDVEKGIEYCGDEEDYLDAIETYKKSINDRIGKLVNDFDKKDMEELTLGAHSLKSMSRAIGATQVAEISSALEQAGKAKDTDKIQELIPDLKSKVVSLLQIL